MKENDSERCTMTIQEIINRIFIGEDMRNYLCEKADKLSKFQIQNMIASASTISLQHKLEFLEFMAQGENLQQELEESPYENDFIIKNSFSVCADNIRHALEALHNSDSSIFILKTHEWKDNEFVTTETIPFTCYKKAIEYIEDEYEKFVYADERIWYTIEKWETDSNGNMKETYSYVIADSIVIYYRHKDAEMDEVCPDINLNLPVPFKAGDIIEVCDYPFIDWKLALIADVGDNMDCCSVREIHVDENGCIVEGALKHGDVFGLHSYMATSPLYCAVKSNCLPDKKYKTLSLLQKYIRNACRK